jgi:hypothetical protein
VRELLALSGLPSGRLIPELLRHTQGINVDFFPPPGLVPPTMEVAVVHPAKRHGEFIAHLAPQGGRMRKPDVMSVGGMRPQTKQA